MKPQSYKFVIYNTKATLGLNELAASIGECVESWAKSGYLIINHICAGDKVLIVMAKDRPE